MNIQNAIWIVLSISIALPLGANQEIAVAVYFKFNIAILHFIIAVKRLHITISSVSSTDSHLK